MPEIEMTKVESSNVDAVGYDQATQTMRVAFKGGGTYDYAGVEAETYNDVLAADSVGRQLNATVIGSHTATTVPVIDS